MWRRKCLTAGFHFSLPCLSPCTRISHFDFLSDSIRTAGVVLEEYIRKYTTLAVLAPVMNGIAGNLGAVNTSRFATSLHADQPETTIRTPVTLFWINWPIQTIFLSIVALL